MPKSSRNAGFFVISSYHAHSRAHNHSVPNGVTIKALGNILIWVHAGGVNLAKLTDMQIKAWIKAGERFEGRSDGNGLYLRYRDVDRVPVWRFRYKSPVRPEPWLSVHMVT
jgi:hypothetical protein